MNKILNIFFRLSMILNFSLLNVSDVSYRYCRFRQ